MDKLLERWKIENEKKKNNGIYFGGNDAVPFVRNPFDHADSGFRKNPGRNS